MAYARGEICFAFAALQFVSLMIGRSEIQLTGNIQTSLTLSPSCLCAAHSSANINQSISSSMLHPVPE